LRARLIYNNSEQLNAQQGLLGAKPHSICVRGTPGSKTANFLLKNFGLKKLRGLRRLRFYGH
jgi:hypothetical protein